MKVNPLGIQAYQNLTRPERPAGDRTDQTNKGTGPDKVTIKPQSAATKSSLAIRVPQGDYSKFLSAEERQALDMLFARFSDATRFGSAYRAESNTDQTAGIGRMIDVKV